LGNNGRGEQQMADIVWCVAVEIWRFYCELSWNVPLLLRVCSLWASNKNQNRTFSVATCWVHL